MRHTVLTFFKHQRFRLVWLLAVILLGSSLVTRIVLLVYSRNQVERSVINVTEIFGLGLFFDLLRAFYFLIPILLYVWLVPERIFQKNFHRYVLVFLLFLFTFILLFDAAAEYFFWDEFNSRFNFIAVDYLIYTTEVIGNIQQSYPIEWILGGLLTLSALITYDLKSFILIPFQEPIRFRQRTEFFAPLLLLPLTAFLLLDTQLHHINNNNFVNELAGNGMYELFAAYRNNELDFETFYPHLTDKEAIDTISKTLQEGNAIRNKDVYSIQHQVTSIGPETKFNVVLISIESFSAEFMNLFGNKQNITPFLDSLAQHSLVFTHLYATGTRTVRGLEALSLSIPPTPGQSIVRRPNNEHLFSMATVFNEKGYESKFIYGGYGYFDNMSYFFSNNGYEVVDRSALNDDEIDYENIWGVADENLFTLASREIEKTVSNRKPSFVHIMTTTNHRPYTYPEGRIDIPSHTGREGAVKYTDYAIGKFIKEASKKDWYANTVFVITADHCASSAGKTELPIQKYKIPMLIFSPGHFTHQTQNRLMSQIDIAPTLLGMLHFSYSSKFFGYDIFKLPKGKERAFISTYQALGYISHDSLAILLPKRKSEILVVNANDDSTTSIKSPSQTTRVMKEAISWYQTASYSFKHGKLKEQD